MDRERVERVIGMLASRGQLEPIDSAPSAAGVCLGRAQERLEAAGVLSRAELWESAYTAAYDAYRAAADAVVLSLGFRVPATAGAHRMTVDVAQAALGDATDAFAPAPAERIRQGRHDSEYFDPARPIDKSSDDVAWALALAVRAVESVRGSLEDE